MQCPTLREFWNTLNRARETGNSPAVFAAARAVGAAQRGHNSDAASWFLLAEYELAHPSPAAVPTAVPTGSEPEQENTATV